jgi:UDP-N-acetylmuramoyl-L-alanyl-D-glutamate--2,6-diaminopimelate ligase
MEKVLQSLKSLIPAKLLSVFLPTYHYLVAYIGAVIYGFPARRIRIIGVTGTKGKSSTVELISSILEEAGERTAIVGTVRFKIADSSRPNLYKMTTPGRFFLQKFLREAADKRCTYAILELSSEAAKQYRHRGIDLDALVFTNLAPEHIESHGSLEKYREAKLSIGHYLTRPKNKKRPRIIVANADDPVSASFLALPADKKITYSLSEATPHILGQHGIEFDWRGQHFSCPLRGKFNLSNILAATSTAQAFNVSLSTIRRALRTFPGIPGRLEEIDEGQAFRVFVDYAHTADSLKAVYETFPDAKKICVLGSTGGGRDKWKRPLMGSVAGTYCDTVILTNEDPYDENPQQIINEVASGVLESGKKPEIIIDRRMAIRQALAYARASKVVLITGKGTDPYIMGPAGEKTPWSDARIVREELRSLLKKDPVGQLF